MFEKDQGTLANIRDVVAFSFANVICIVLEFQQHRAFILVPRV
jgi:hypothetical protein